MYQNAMDLNFNSAFQIYSTITFTITMVHVRLFMHLNKIHKIKIITNTNSSLRFGNNEIKHYNYS